MRSENVPESPSSALQTMYFCVDSRAEHGLPLDAGGKRRAAAAAQTRIGDGLDDVLGRHRERVVEAAKAAVRAIVLDAERIGDADARERQAFLPLEERNRFDRADAKAMHAAALETRIEQAGTSAGLIGP